MIDKVLEGSGWCRRISSTDIDRRNEKLAQLNHSPDKSGDLPKTETWLSFTNKQTPINKIFPPSDQLRQQRLPPLLTPASYP